MQLPCMFFFSVPRLATPLSYFISELLCVPRSQLDNVREIPLFVATVPIHQSSSSANTEPPPQTKRPRLLFEEESIVSLLSRVQAWVLDVDLDFFSTGNPYRGPFSAVSCILSVGWYMMLPKKQMDLLSCYSNWLSLVLAVWDAHITS